MFQNMQVHSLEGRALMSLFDSCGRVYPIVDWIDRANFMRIGQMLRKRVILELACRRAVCA